MGSQGSKPHLHVLGLIHSFTFLNVIGLIPNRPRYGAGKKTWLLVQFSCESPGKSLPETCFSDSCFSDARQGARLPPPTRPANVAGTVCRLRCAARRHRPEAASVVAVRSSGMVEYVGLPGEQTTPPCARADSQLRLPPCAWAGPHPFAIRSHKENVAPCAVFLRKSWEILTRNFKTGSPVASTTPPCERHCPRLPASLR